MRVLSLKHVLSRCFLLPLALLGLPTLLAAEEAPSFPPESVYDTSVQPDEALVNVKILNHRWPDCDTLETTIRDIFRIEGVDKTPGPDEAKALSLWKWFRVLVCNAIPHAEEGPIGKTVRQRDPHKSISVYGWHECGGLSSPLSALWRAAGFIGYKESSDGHSTVVMRYPDKDGIWRMHAFDAMSGCYYWDKESLRVGYRTYPLMNDTVLRTLDDATRHTNRTSLLWGETLRRQWDCERTILRNNPYNMTADFLETHKDYAYTSELLKDKGPSKEEFYSKYFVYEAGPGLEVQTLDVDATPANFKKPLWKDSVNTACSAASESDAALHPEAAGKPAAFIYRMASPYVAVECLVEADLKKAAADDLLTLSFSIDDGKTWVPFLEKKTAGKESLTADIGNKLYLDKKPSVTSNYTFFIKAEMQTAGAVNKIGLDKLKISVKRQLNSRMLMNLMPGENVLVLTGDKMEAGMALEASVTYTVNGAEKKVTKTTDKFPFYFKIDVDGIKDEDYLKKMRHNVTQFNIGDKNVLGEKPWPLRMTAIEMRLVDAKSAKLDTTLPAAEGEAAFKKSSPHPFDHFNNKDGLRFSNPPKYDTEVDDFFPQRPKAVADDSEEGKKKYETALAAYEKKGKRNRKAGDVPFWLSIENLGEFTQGLDPLLALLQKPNDDTLIYVCKGLSRIGDPKAVAPLMAFWNKNPMSLSPGARYIPDVVAACGDQSQVPDLIKPYNTLRCDYRYHIIHAIGILGGSKAKAHLEYAAKNDPFQAVRDLAQEFLKKGVPGDK